MKLLRWGAALALAAMPTGSTGCTSPTETGGAPVIGTYCASTTPSVARSGSNATVTLRENTTRYEDRPRASDGVLVRHEIRSCDTRSCTYVGGANYTDDQLVAACECRCTDPLG